MSMQIVPPPDRPARPGRVLSTLRRWLGLEEQAQLVAGQRRDFDKLGQTLQVKDADARALRHSVGELERQQAEVIGQLNRVTQGLVSLNDRLTHYERTVPTIAKAKRAYHELQQREERRRKALIEAHPELSEADRQYVMRTGELPTETAPAPDAPATGVSDSVAAAVQDQSAG